MLAPHLNQALKILWLALTSKVEVGPSLTPMKSKAMRPIRKSPPVMVEKEIDMNELLWLTIFTSACHNQPLQYQNACSKGFEATVKQVGIYETVEKAEAVLVTRAEKKTRKTIGNQVYDNIAMVAIGGLTAKRFREGQKISLRVPNPVYKQIYVEGAKTSGGLMVRFDF